MNDSATSKFGWNGVSIMRLPYFSANEPTTFCRCQIVVELSNVGSVSWKCHHRVKCVDSACFWWRLQDHISCKRCAIQSWIMLHSYKWTGEQISTCQRVRSKLRKENGCRFKRHCRQGTFFCPFRCANSWTLDAMSWYNTSVSDRDIQYLMWHYWIKRRI